MKTSKLIIRLITLFLFVGCVTSIIGQTTEFVQKATLPDGPTPATAAYSMEFKLFDSLVGGNQIGVTVTLENVEVKNREYTVTLDFGEAVFSGSDRYLEVSARPGTSAGPLLAVTPRIKVKSVPYAIRSLKATSADNSENLGGAAAGNFVQTNDARLTDARPPLAGSPFYIHNSSVLQSSSNFYISGNGTADGTLSGNIVSAKRQYNLGTFRILAAEFTNFSSGVYSGDVGSGAFNTFVGNGAGSLNTTGAGNAFFGYSAGSGNTTGRENSFFGVCAGCSNASGSANSFFGLEAGFSNQTASNNSFFGYKTGSKTTSGPDNSFFGANAGRENTTGERNAFFGRSAGARNVVGSANAFFGEAAGAYSLASGNAFFGAAAGISTTTGGYNTFVGLSAGFWNVSGSNNTFVGSQTGFPLGTPNVDYSTAIGFGAVVTTSNTIVLGRLTEKTVAAGTMRIASIPLAPAVGAVCFNATGDLIQCGASSLRLKGDVRPFTSGLEAVRRLYPITYRWKENQMSEIGLSAENVLRAVPGLALTDAEGRAEGVRYERLGVLLINAIKEQQSTITELRRVIANQQKILNQHQKEITILITAINRGQHQSRTVSRSRRR